MNRSRLKFKRYRSWIRSRRRIAWLISHPRADEAVLISIALVIGLGAGFGAIGFSKLIAAVQYVAFSGGRQALGFMGRYYVILLPALGGLIVGPLIYKFAREAKGHGVPEVMEAVALRGGRIRPVVVVIKALASSICIGSGGAAGREGPIVQIGSAWGSTVGQLLKLSEDRIRVLVACGAAGGIAATFNAPVGGVLFALEVILGEFTVSHFGTVVVSAVSASVVSRVFVGNAPAFAVPPHAMKSPWELPLYALLGLISALFGVAFMKILYWTEDRFLAWRFPEYFKPVFGGLAVGLIGLFYPQVFGVGYETIEAVLHSQVVLGTTAALIFLKLAATSLTLGSGGSGGVFAPSLFMGAMLGGTFGELASRIWPNVVGNSGAFALVGMSAVFAAGSRAPITAVLILFEMTADYRLILPLMLSTVIAALVAGALESESIYTLKLVRRGVRLERGRDIDVMQSVQVAEVMERQPQSVPSSLPVAELVRRFEDSKRQSLPVLDEQGQLAGLISLPDLDEILASPENQSRPIADFVSPPAATVNSSDGMWVALQRMGAMDVSSLPVVDPADPNRLVGMIRHRDIVRAYNLSVVRRHSIQQRVERIRLRGAQAGFVDLNLTDRSAAAGRKLAELTLPQDCIVVSIRRGDQVVIPRGNTVLLSGDHVTVFARKEREQEVRQAFEDGDGKPETGNRRPAESE